MTAPVSPAGRRGSTGLAEQIRDISTSRGGGGEVRLAFDQGLHRDRPWQATTTIKPAYHPDRRLWVWGSDPTDALSRLLYALKELPPR
jgi:hypothetical protein